MSISFNLRRLFGLSDPTPLPLSQNNPTDTDKLPSYHDVVPLPAVRSSSHSRPPLTPEQRQLQKRLHAFLIQTNFMFPDVPKVSRRHRRERGRNPPTYEEVMGGSRRRE